MLKHETLIATIEVAAEQQGFSLNGQDKLIIRTRVSSVLAAKERQRQRMNTGAFEWKKPSAPRR